MAATIGCAHSSPHHGLQRFEFTQPEMGVPFQIVLYAANESVATNAASAVLDRVQQLNAILSDYDTDSELSRLSQTSGKGERVPVSRDLWNVLARAQQLARETDGAFDVTIGPLVALWRKARREKHLPDPGRIEEAKASVGYEKMVLFETDHSVQLLKKNMRLDVGAIAKGYAADAAISMLRSHGIHNALAAAVGDIAVSGTPPGKRGWQIEVVPFDTQEWTNRLFAIISNGAISTSGDAAQRLEINGKRYSHIVDPKTGMGLTDHSLVTTIARDCMTADSLATAVSVVGPEKGLKLVAKYPAASVRIVRKPASKLEVFESPGWKQWIRNEPLSSPLPASQKGLFLRD